MMNPMQIDITGLDRSALMKLLEGASAEKLLALERAGTDATGHAMCPFCAAANGVHAAECALEARLVASGVDAEDDE